MRVTVISLWLSTIAPGLTLLAGCDPALDSACERDPEFTLDVRPLVSAAAWSPTALADDPLADHQPDQVMCPSSSWAAEFDALELRTGECNYFSVEQPLLEPIAVGDPLRVQVWWQSLIAPEPAIGHLAVVIDGVLVWELEVAIPGASEARSFTLASPIAAAPGAIVTLHLHNHGANTWTFAELARLDAEPDPSCE